MRYYFFFLFYSCSFFTNAINVALVNPTHKEETFWALITKLTKETAVDLNINLAVYYSDSHRVIQSELIKTIVNGKNKPDYLIFMPYGGSILKSFNALENAKVPFVTVERVFDIDKVSQIQRPQEVYKYWLGEVYNDNIAAGQLLANALLRKLKEIKPLQHTYNAVALNGNYYAESLDRAEGFYHAYINIEQVRVNQVVPVGWNRAEASKRFLRLHKRYGTNDIVWAASDQMALGVLDVIDKTELKPNIDFVVGGIDLIPEAIQAISDNRLTATVGGHFLQGVWALTKLYDHHHGIKNVFIKGDDTPYVKESVITTYNIEEYKVLAEAVDFALVDFSSFSLFENNHKEAKSYDLSLEHFIKQLNLVKSQ